MLSNNNRHLMTTGIIFSYNRALQLDALLRSFLEHCQECTSLQLSILYRTEGDLHNRQYLLLAETYKDYDFITFVNQEDFRSDVLRLLATPKQGNLGKELYSIGLYAPPFIHKTFHLSGLFDLNGFVLFLVDDALFVRDFNLGEIRQMLNQHQDALGFSLRLGLNTTYCYAKDIPQNLSDFTRFQPSMLKYEWSTATADYAYPLEISSSIYRIRDILPLMIGISFQNPNLLEGRMAARARYFAADKPYLLCYEQSAAFCYPINKVQETYNNRSGSKLNYSIDHLSRLFESGYRIDIHAYEGFIPSSVHQEIELALQKSH